MFSMVVKSHAELYKYIMLKGEKEHEKDTEKTW